MYNCIAKAHEAYKNEKKQMRLKKKPMQKQTIELRKK
jgi:hypothetical protein